MFCVLKASVRQDNLICVISDRCVDILNTSKPTEEILYLYVLFAALLLKLLLKKKKIFLHVERKGLWTISLGL